MCGDNWCFIVSRISPEFSFILLLYLVTLQYFQDHDVVIQLRKPCVRQEPRSRPFSFACIIWCFRGGIDYNDSYALRHRNKKIHVIPIIKRINKPNFNMSSWPLLFFLLNATRASKTNNPISCTNKTNCFTKKSRECHVSIIKSHLSLVLFVCKSSWRVGKIHEKVFSVHTPGKIFKSTKLWLKNQSKEMGKLIWHVPFEWNERVKSSR